MRINLKALAEEAGLSPTAVSLILNGKQVRISSEKKQRVMELAAKYNYTPNSLAVGLVTKKTNTIGLIIPDVANHFFADIAKNLEKKLSQEGYILILCNTSDTLSEESKYANMLLSKDVDALVVCPTNESVENHSYIDSFIEAGKRVVVFDRYSLDMPCSTVASDNFSAGENAVEYLIKQGHRKIACITGPSTSYSANLRVNGYKSALAKNGITVDDSLIFEGNYQFDSGYFKGLEALKVKGVTAVFACNDLMAYGVYRAAKESRIRIPQDVSVMGFDDLFFSAMAEVPLTSVKQDTGEICKQICRLIHSDDIEHIVLDTAIVERDSVSAPVG